MNNNSEATLIFPHQLYENNPALAKDRKVIIIEEPLFFYDQKYPVQFHRQKLLLHRASLKCYEDKLKKKNYDISYLDYSEYQDPSDYFKFINDNNIHKIHVTDPVDYELEQRMKRSVRTIGLELKIYQSPNFIYNTDYLNSYFDSNKYYQTGFYKAQRKNLSILYSKEKGPAGGRWTYDIQNRKKLPDDVKIPEREDFPSNHYIEEARKYISKNFNDNPGELDKFNYPVNRTQALKNMNDFFNRIFSGYGPYQDAISFRDPFLFHSLLSPALNIGLLAPGEIIDKTLESYHKESVQLQSVEGFIRQILGWREFMRAIYIREGSKQRTMNFFNFKNKLNKRWYKATTGIKPLDDVINKVNKYAYAHHIERLMIVGNLMLLCEIDPDEVYRWFMELFIDAYDWVMVPNVYGMSQYADGGLMTTKPYISSSNYILKMSDYKKADWCGIWDALYWRFLYKNQDKFAGNHRMTLMLSILKKRPKSVIKDYVEIGDRFIKKVTS
jgi:deoxyribodipyrimidine photolyase-related protein